MQKDVADMARVSVITSRLLAVGVMLITTLLMSFNGLIIRNIEFANPWQINVYRSLGFLVTISIIYYFHNPSLSKIEIGSINAPSIWAGLCLAVTGIAITQALVTTTVANTVFIMSSIPFLTMVLGYYFLKEKLSLASIIAIAISMVGIIIMVTDGMASLSSYGNFMAILTSLGFAGFAVILRAHNKLDMLPSLLIGGLIVIVVSIFFSSGDLRISSHDLLLCLLWGAGISSFAHWAIIVASLFLKAAELTIFTLLEFALAPLWVWLFISETPTPIALIGGMIVLSAVTTKVIIDLMVPR